MSSEVSFPSFEHENEGRIQRYELKSRLVVMWPSEVRAGVTRHTYIACRLGSPLTGGSGRRPFDH